MLKIRNRAQSTAAPKLPLTWSEPPSAPGKEQDKTAKPAVEPAAAREPTAITATAAAAEPVAATAELGGSAATTDTAVSPPAASGSVDTQACTASDGSKPAAASSPNKDKQPQAAAESLTAAPKQSASASKTVAASTPITASQPSPRAAAAKVAPLPSIPAEKVGRQAQAAVPKGAAARQTASSGKPSSVYNIAETSDSLGLQLLHYRANARLSVEEIAKRTHVSRDFIVNLEEGNYHKLPADPFCLREIERICFEYDIDPDPLKELFEQESQAAGRETASLLPASAGGDRGASRNVLSPLGLSPETSRSHSLYSLPGLIIGILVVGILVLVASAFFYQQSQRSKPLANPQQPKIDAAQHIKPRRPPLDLLQIPAN
jgi:transcriptional regulator with XRE-family HTH domain